MPYSCDHAFRVRCLPLWLAAGVLLLSPLAARANPPSAAPSIVIPFDNQAGHGDIIMHIRVNNKLTGNFLLDTGAGVSIVNGDFVEKLGLHITPTVRRPPLYMSGREIDDVTLSHLLLGNMALHDIDFFVEPGTGGLKNGSESVCAKEEAKERKEHPERFTGTESLDQSVDGILGLDILSQFALLIDFEKGEITAWPQGRLSAAEIQDAGMDKATVVSMSQEYYGGNHCYVNVDVTNGAKRGTEKMVLDTGAEDTLIAPHLADTINVLVKRQGFSQTFYGCLPFSRGIVDSVGLNGLLLPKVDVSFTRKAPEDFPLLLGYNIFARCRVLFDFPANKLYLQPDPEYDKQDKPGAQYSDAIAYRPGPNGQIFVPVQFDGDKTGTAVVDTGANQTILSPDTAARLNMTLTPMLDGNGNPVSFGGQAMQGGSLPIMRFGGTGVAGFHCLVSHDPLKIAGGPVDVILGNDFLSAFLPYIDFQKHQVTFLQCRDLTGGDFDKLDFGGSATIPVVKPAADLCAATIQVTAKKSTDETFLVSTVDQATVLSNRVAQTLNLKPSGPAIQIETSLGSVTAAPVALNELSMTGVDAPDGTRFYMQTDTNALPLSILGLDVLCQYRVLLHYADGRLYLANPTKAKPVTPSPPAPASAPPAAAAHAQNAVARAGSQRTWDRLRDGLRQTQSPDTVK